MDGFYARLAFQIVCNGLIVAWLPIMVVMTYVALAGARHGWRWGRVIVVGMAAAMTSLTLGTLGVGEAHSVQMLGTAFAPLTITWGLATAVGAIWQSRRFHLDGGPGLVEPEPDADLGSVAKPRPRWFPRFWFPVRTRNTVDPVWEAEQITLEVRDLYDDYATTGEYPALFDVSHRPTRLLFRSLTSLPPRSPKAQLRAAKRLQRRFDRALAYARRAATRELQQRLRRS